MKRHRKAGEDRKKSNLVIIVIIIISENKIYTLIRFIKENKEASTRHCHVILEFMLESRIYLSENNKINCLRNENEIA